MTERNKLRPHGIFLNSFSQIFEGTLRIYEDIKKSATFQALWDILAYMILQPEIHYLFYIIIWF